MTNDLTATRPSTPRPEETPIVALRDVYKYHYTDAIETAALNGLSLRIREREFVAIMGPSGSGKSTLLNIIGMVDTPSSGSYRFKGQEVTELKASRLSDLRKRNLAFIFQSFNLIDELTAEENVELPLQYLGIKGSERKKRVAHALAELEMLHRRDHYPPQLSGGQQQRVAIARALVTEPALILADEPTGNLDSENSRIVMDKLAELHTKGSTIIMVTHSPEDAAYASRRIELFDGVPLQSEHQYLRRPSGE